MPYVSAVYAPPSNDPLMPTAKAGELPVIATDDEGVEWHLTEDSQVGDWLRFMESGGTVLAARDVPEAKPAKGERK
jgi:hypothetical protein